MTNLAAEEREFGPGCRDLEIDGKKLKAMSDPPSSKVHRGILPSSEPSAGSGSSDTPAGDGGVRSRRVPDDLFADTVKELSMWVHVVEMRLLPSPGFIPNSGFIDIKFRHASCKYHAVHNMTQTEREREQI